MHPSRLVLALSGWLVFVAGANHVHAQTKPAPHPAQLVSDTARTVEMSLSDSVASPSEESFRLSDSSKPASLILYPSDVSTDPGYPRKPVWERPGDYNASQAMSPRYCQDDCFRAGWPHQPHKHATCSVNKHYYAWYVGGGAGLPFLNNRHRTAEEGTWGLDYSLWKKPRTVFMKWTCGRLQGGEGAYQTDREPLF